MDNTEEIVSKRTAANQKNSKKSTGPRTDEGKARSSRNALKHGLTAADAVLPNEDPEAFQQHMDDWLEYYQPDDPAVRAVVERAAVAEWKLHRCTRYETATLAKKVRHAEVDFERDELIRVETLGRRLLFEPLDRCRNPEVHDPVVHERIERREADNPAVLAKEMEASLHGVEWLHDRWGELVESLKFFGFWHYPERLKAIRLMGRRPEDVLEDMTVARLTLASNAAHPEPWQLWDTCHQASLGTVGKPMFLGQLDLLQEQAPPSTAEGVKELWDLTIEEVHRLEALRETLRPLAEADRAGACERAMFDDSASGVLLRRYETACERELHRSLADLMKLRKDTAARNELRQEVPAQNEAMPEAETEAPVASPAPEECGPELPSPGRFRRRTASAAPSPAPSVPETAPPDAP